MKHYILALLVGASTLMISCNADQAVKTQLTSEKNLYMIDIEDEFYDIVYNDGGYNLEDLDSFYKKIKTTRKNDLNYNNLRKIIISTMLQSKNLLEVDDISTLEYYVNELISMPYISNMSELHTMLSGLAGHWSNEEISKTALMLIKRNNEYIKENFPDPNKVRNLPHQAQGAQNMLYLALLD